MKNPKIARSKSQERVCHDTEICRPKVTIDNKRIASKVNRGAHNIGSFKHSSIQARIRKAIEMMLFYTVLILQLVVSQAEDFGQKCFRDTNALYFAARDYVLSGSSPNSGAAIEYGYPIGSWCTSSVKDFSYVFLVSTSTCSMDTSTSTSTVCF
jgi:hypothetical protein